jgi:hypothetical protein
MDGTCQVMALKFDGRLHYTFPARVIYRDNSVIRAQWSAGTIIRHLSRGLEFPEKYDSELWAWDSCWYNVFVNRNEGGELDSFYCNVATPPTIHLPELRWIDLDLDVRIFVDGRYEILDEDEFEEHRLKYNYPVDVQHQAKQAVRDILDLARLRDGPFALLSSDPHPIT